MARPQIPKSADTAGQISVRQYPCLFAQIDRWHYQLVATNTPAKTVQCIQARHRSTPRWKTTSAPARKRGWILAPAAIARSTGLKSVAATIAADLLARLHLLCLDSPLVRSGTQNSAPGCWTRPAFCAASAHSKR